MLWVLSERLCYSKERKPDHLFKDEANYSCVNIVAIEEESFNCMNLTDGATFPIAQIKSENQDSIKNNYPHHTKRRIR